MSEAAALLEVWFGDDLESPREVNARVGTWFGRDPAFDTRLRRQFGALPDRAIRGELDAWRGESRSALALVLSLDQLPRNLFRNTSQAFAYDAAAREVALAALDRDFDGLVSPVEAVFFYMPLQHAEDPASQARSVALFGALRERAPATLRTQFESFASYAVRHRDVIRRFGRFPHRNAILERQSTPEEMLYLNSADETL